MIHLKSIRHHAVHTIYWLTSKQKVLYFIAQQLFERRRADRQNKKLPETGLDNINYPACYCAASIYWLDKRLPN